MKLYKKACPFCSYNQAKVFVSEPLVYIACTLCKSRGPEFEFENEEEDNFTLQEAYEMAMDRWNNRFVNNADS